MISGIIAAMAKVESGTSTHEEIETAAIKKVFSFMLEHKEWHPKLKECFETGDQSGLIALIREFITECSKTTPIPTKGLGIRVLEANTDRPEGEDCFRYYFPEGDTQETMDMINDMFERVSEPQAGDTIVYTLADGTIKHIGKFTENGLVVSKWGKDGHVIEHPTIIAPTEYGPILHFFRPPQNQP